MVSPIVMNTVLMSRCGRQKLLREGATIGEANTCSDS